MGEIRLDNCCRLCLKEGFSLANIFSQRSAAGDPLHCILNFIYDIKISENDGLPSQICSPCMWRMIEFDACKRNVRSAEAEIMRLLTQIRPHIIEVSNDGAVLVAKESEMDSTGEVGTEGSIVHSEAPVKEEINVLEWENPIQTEMEGHIPEALQKYEEDDLESTEVEADEVPVQSANEGVFCLPLRKDQLPESLQKFEEDDLESTEVEADEVKVELFQDNCNQHVFCQPLRETPVSLDIKNILSLEVSEGTVGNSFEGESSAVCTTQGISSEIRYTNKGKHENDLRDHNVPDEEFSGISKCILNVRKSGQSHLKATLSKRKSGFICDICKKTFQHKVHLGDHMSVHNDERPFSCTICDKRFKLDNYRYRHELLHLRDKVSLGNSEKGSKKTLFSCSICAKNFSTKNGLDVHFYIHSDKYKCNSCGKCFGNNIKLSDHLRIHTKEKPFKCEVCLKCFNQKGILNRHMLIHSSERPFFCDICDKRFKSKQEKTRHELYHLRKR